MSKFKSLKISESNILPGYEVLPMDPAAIRYRPHRIDFDYNCNDCGKITKTEEYVFPYCGKCHYDKERMKNV